jgi:hypothetical protein
MKLERFSALLTLAANLGVLAGIVVLIVELDQNTEHLRLQLLDQINARQYAHNSIFLSENPGPVIEKALLEPENLSFTEFQIMDAYLLNALNGWEDRFFLYDARLVSESDWKSKVDEEAAWYLGSAFGKAWWRDTARNYFEPEFSEHVDVAVARLGDGDSYAYWMDLKSKLRAQP